MSGLDPKMWADLVQLVEQDGLSEARYFTCLKGASGPELVDGDAEEIFTLTFPNDTEDWEVEHWAEAIPLALNTLPDLVAEVKRLRAKVGE